MEMVLIEWLDARSNDGWLTMEDAQAMKPAEVETVGWIISEDELVVRVSPSIDEEEEMVDYCLAIPRCCIKNIQKFD